MCQKKKNTELESKYSDLNWTVNGMLNMWLWECWRGIQFQKNSVTAINILVKMIDHVLRIMNLLEAMKKPKASPTLTWQIGDNHKVLTRTKVPSSLRIHIQVQLGFFVERRITNTHPNPTQFLCRKKEASKLHLNLPLFGFCHRTSVWHDPVLLELTVAVAKFEFECCLTCNGMWLMWGNWPHSNLQANSLLYPRFAH